MDASPIMTNVVEASSNIKLHFDVRLYL